MPCGTTFRFIRSHQAWQREWVGREGNLERVPVDPCCVLPPAEWGAIPAIRTGRWQFSRGLVVKRKFGEAKSPDGPYGAVFPFLEVPPAPPSKGGKYQGRPDVEERDAASTIQ